MSKVLCICVRGSAGMEHFCPNIETLDRNLVPDNATVLPPIVRVANDQMTVVFNPSPSLLVYEGSVCLGALTGKRDDWHKPDAPVPDGSFAIFRCGEGVLELLTDIVASRTIWYFKNDDFFIASTSQRAIVHCLKTFEPNLDAFAWMLSTGTLGPGNAWDRRILQMRPDSRLRLDQKLWTLSIETADVQFEPLDYTWQENKQRLQDTLRNSFAELEIDYSKWELLLSGGYDSRAILIYLQNREGLRSTTWGTRGATEDSTSDATIAKKLATNFGIEHQYMVTDESRDDFETITRRYLMVGEGRVDHISAYLDGLRIWAAFQKEGKGVIRGDEAFGKYQVDNSFETRDCVALRTLQDCHNLKGIDFELPKQHLPEYLRRRGGESLDTWRDRLNQQYELPTVWAALNDVKCAYVEVMNPLLSRKSVMFVRTLPDEMRTEKSLFSDLVRSISPRIPFAERQATAPQKNVLRSKATVDFLTESINSIDGRNLLASQLRAFITENVKVVGSSDELPVPSKKRTLVKRMVPSFARRMLKGLTQHPITDVNILAFRAFVVVEMCRILRDDAQTVLSCQRSKP